MKLSIFSGCGPYCSCYLLSAEKHFKFSITVFFFFFLHRKKLYLSPDRCSARHSEMYFQKLFTLSSLHPHLYFHSCTAKKWEAVMLTVASLQSLFNGTSIPASPRDADWGKMRRLTVTAGYGRPASCSSYPLCRNLRILSQVGRNIFAFVNSWI